MTTGNEVYQYRSYLGADFVSESEYKTKLTKDAMVYYSNNPEHQRKVQKFLDTTSESKMGTITLETNKTMDEIVKENPGLRVNEFKDNIKLVKPKPQEPVKEIYRGRIDFNYDQENHSDKPFNDGNRIRYFKIEFYFENLIIFVSYNLQLFL